MGRLKAGLQRHTLRVLMPVLRRVPAPLSAVVIEGLGWINYKLVPGNTEIYESAVRRGRDELGEDWDDRVVARRLASGLVHWRSRDRLLDGLTDAQALRRFEVTGREHLDRAYAQKRGVILLGNHFGSHLHPTHWMYREKYPLRLFMERPRNVSKYMTDQFRTDGTLGQEKLFISRRSTATEAAGSILRAMKILNAGMVLQIAGDVRWQGAHTAPGHFLGSTYLFSTTWVVLAAMTGAPVVPVFCRPDRHGHYLLEFLPSFRVPAETPRNGQATTYVQRGLDHVADQVRRHPDQSNDYFTWPKPEISLTRVA
jgi:phosphatidylinositol dimannoside acyltransferase